MSNIPNRSETYVNRSAAASKALSTLKGLLDGVACDQILNELERRKIVSWIEQHAVVNSHPLLGSVFDYLAEALVDGVLTLEEVSNLRWMIDRNLSSFYDDTTVQMQELHGVLAGVAADRVVSPTELKFVVEWLDRNESLRGMFPYDEVYSLVCQVKDSNSISPSELNFLIRAFEGANDKSIMADNPFMPYAVDPQIVFLGRSFCITGKSHKMKRSEIEKSILKHGALVSGTVSNKTDFLVVCPESNIAWTHASYGRKVEQAIRLRKLGKNLQIILEKDLWDALVA